MFPSRRMPHPLARLHNIHAGATGYLLGKGPSLARWVEARPRADDVEVGLNEAGLMQGTRYTVASDPYTVEALDRQLAANQVLIYPHNERTGRIAPTTRRIPFLPRKTPDHDSPMLCELLWWRSSASTAIALLAWMGVARIIAYGCDGVGGYAPEIAAALPYFPNQAEYPRIRSSMNSLQSFYHLPIEYVGSEPTPTHD